MRQELSLIRDLDGLFRVLEGPASRLPATVAALREKLGILDTASNAALEAVLIAVSRAFCGVDGLGREWWLQTYEERWPPVPRWNSAHGETGCYLSVRRWPVERVIETDLDPASLQVYGERRNVLLRTNPLPADGFQVTYSAGWLSPALVSDWEPEAEISAGQWTRATRPSLLRAEAMSSGTFGPAEPDWPAEPGAEIADGSVRWKMRQVEELPEDIQAAAVITAAQWYRGDVDVARGLTMERDPSGATSYRGEGVDALPLIAQRVLRSYR